MLSSDDEHMLYLKREEVELACQEIDSVSLIREMFKLHASGQTALPDEAYLEWRNARGEMVRSLSLPGYVGGDFGSAGTKIINGNPANPSRGMPRASGITLLYDDVSARPLCMMESAYLSSLRTASVSALSIDLFGGTTIKSLALIGAGVLAQAHTELISYHLSSLRTIYIFDLEGARVHAFINKVTSLMTDRGIEIHVASTAEEAVKQAQLVIPVTTTTSGYIPFKWIQPGALLVNISLDDFLPDVVFGADAVIVDDWNLVKNDPRRLLGRMYRAGQLIGPDEEAPKEMKEHRRIDAQLGDVVLGNKLGRRSSNEIIMVNPFGLAIEDVALATHVYRVARVLGLGTLLEY